MPYLTSADIPEFTDAELRQMLFELCIRNNDVEGMKRAFDGGVDIEANCYEYGEGNTLVMAAHEGSLNAVGFLLSVGAERMSASVAVAAVKGHLEIVELLLANGVKPSSDALIGVDNEEVLKRLIFAGAPVNAPSSHGLWFPIHNAVLEGRTRIVEILLQAGANPDMKTEDGATPLIMAVLAEDLTLVKQLIGHGANLLLENDEGKTALSLAKENNWAEGILFLTEESSLRAFPAPATPTTAG